MEKKSEIVVSVVGLGYVGLPVALAMSKAFKCIGFDINGRRVHELKEGHDRTHEVSSEELKSANMVFSSDPAELKAANFHIVAVPTPIDQANQPDLKPVLSASESVGRFLKKGDIVVYESTVYPGLTEEKCLPVLEKFSGLKGGVDFKIGYSPERINPGDKEHTFTKIKKIVAGQDAESLETIAHVYGSVVTAGVYRASSIQVAEAAKIIENTQRDLNIALINELALIFDRMHIDTQDVLAAAGTKWNFLKFSPGLVGGHCIGVDPYYLTHKAEEMGYIPQVILAGRRINDSMGKFVATQTIKKMIEAGNEITGARVTILGLTFKENCPDLRNSKVVDIIRELKEFGVEVQVHDPLADAEDAAHEMGLKIVPYEQLKQSAGVIVAVAHDDYRKLTPKDFLKQMPNKAVVIDVKGIYDAHAFKAEGISHWRL
jgi:UDP-N-acetyl-D-galactosamine dehydrogenase